MENSKQPAYPMPKGRSPLESDKNGLTKRELIAAMAMQGILASVATGNYEKISEWSVRYADALLSELDKPTNK